MINSYLPNHHEIDDISHDAQLQHQASNCCQLATRNARHATRNPQPVTRNSHPVPRNSQRATRNPQPAYRSRILATVVIFLLICFFSLNLSAATSDNAEDAFIADIKKLSSYGDRTTGSSGNAAAAAYIKSRFAALGIETVGMHKFDVATIKPKKSTLTLPNRGISIPVRPMRSNAVTPQTIPGPGITAPLVYVGHGDFHEINGKAIEGSIILMELESGRNWQYAADLGAKALIYVDRGDASNLLLEEKFELSPLQFPRFWMPLYQVRDLFNDFETRPAGHLADAG